MEPGQFHGSPPSRQDLAELEQLLRFRAAEALVLATELAAAVKAGAPALDQLGPRLAEALQAIRTDPAGGLLAEIGAALAQR